MKKIACDCMKRHSSILKCPCVYASPCFFKNDSKEALNVSGKSPSMMDAMLGVCDSLRQNAGCPSLYEKRERDGNPFLAESLLHWLHSATTRVL